MAALILETEVIKVTPEIAKAWLAKDTRNRNLSDSAVKVYEQDMLAGKWQLDGEPIIFDSQGQLKNGQHRLVACMQSGASFETVVVHGVDPSAFMTMDEGRRRCASDDLYLPDEVNCRDLASALKLLFLHERGLLPRGLTLQVSGPQILETLERHPGVRASVTFVHRCRHVLVGRLAASCHHRFSQKDPPEADRFIEDLATGASLSRSDPVLRLRERLMRNKAEKSKLPAREISPPVLKSWSARRRGETLTYLRWRTHGEKPEPLPDIA